MECNKFKCIYENDGECEPLDGECIGDMCESFGECQSCQMSESEECDRESK